MSAKLKKDKREPVRIQLKKNDQVKVIAGRDRGKTGRVLDVDSATGPHSGRARQHDQAAHEEESGQADRRRHRRKGSADRGFECDDRVREVRPGRGSDITCTEAPGGKTRRTRVCRKCGQTLDKK